jgi:hypothetical protein
MAGGMTSLEFAHGRIRPHKELQEKIVKPLEVQK